MKHHKQNAPGMIDPDESCTLYPTLNEKRLVILNVVSRATQRVNVSTCQRVNVSLLSGVADVAFLRRAAPARPGTARADRGDDDPQANVYQRAAGHTGRE